jgi:hypothetical protein
VDLLNSGRKTSSILCEQCIISVANVLLLASIDGGASIVGVINVLSVVNVLLLARIDGCSGDILILLLTVNVHSILLCY